MTPPTGCLDRLLQPAWGRNSRPPPGVLRGVCEPEHLGASRCTLPLWYLLIALTYMKDTHGAQTPLLPSRGNAGDQRSLGPGQHLDRDPREARYLQRVATNLPQTERALGAKVKRRFMQCILGRSTDLRVSRLVATEMSPGQRAGEEGGGSPKCPGSWWWVNRSDGR